MITGTFTGEELQQILHEIAELRAKLHRECLEAEHAGTIDILRRHRARKAAVAHGAEAQVKTP